MMTSYDPRKNPASQLSVIVGSACRLGVELDEVDVIYWKAPLRVGAWPCAWLLPIEKIQRDVHGMDAS